MSTDFSKYQTIIEKLRGEAGSNDFDAKFNALTKKLTKTDKFLLKMEIKRLATPCTRLIDLRGLVNGECRPYEYEGKVHFLDDIAIKVFEENIAYYGGYTFGVYDAVTNTENNFRVIYQKEKSLVQTDDDINHLNKSLEKNTYPARLYSTANYHYRREERMNFACNVSISTDDKEFFTLVSSDISVSGCKLRITDMKPLHLDQIVTLVFNGLENEFNFKDKSKYQYQVRNISLVDKIQLIGFERIDSNVDEDDAFKQFLYDYIQKHKRRYKINLDNTFTALHTRIFEHFSLPKTNELSVFIEKNTLAVKYALSSHNSQSVFQYWQDENSHSTLHFLLNKQRIERLKKLGQQQSSLLVYCFVHQNQGKDYFYSADEYQLKKDKASMAQFLGFAASKDNFAIFNLSLASIDSHLCHAPLTVINSGNQIEEYVNAPPSELVQKSVDNLAYMVAITDITVNDMMPVYQQLDCEIRDIEKLKQFGHRKSQVQQPVEDVGINYSEQRQESRFLYQTSAVIRKDGVEYQGKIKDFSVSGLNVELAKIDDLKKGDVVKVAFPKLQKMTSKFSLKDLPYEIVRVNKQKTIFRLRAYVEKHQHEGRTFFKFLIERNSDKLQLDEYSLTIPGLAKALRNLYAQYFTAPSLMVQTSGSRYKGEALISSRTPSEVLNKMALLSDRENYFNLYPFFHQSSALNTLMTQLKKMQTNDDPINEIVYLAINTKNEAANEGSEYNIVSKFASELNSPELQKAFIANALKRGDFLCLEIKLSRTNAPDMNYLTPELSYISTYAIHRAKQLEQEILSVAGVMQLINITPEAMMRYHLL